MSRFARITEDPEYEIEIDEDADWQDIDAEQSARVFQKIVEELSPFETSNS